MTDPFTARDASTVRYGLCGNLHYEGAITLASNEIIMLICYLHPRDFVREFSLCFSEPQALM